MIERRPQPISFDELRPAREPIDRVIAALRTQLYPPPKRIVAKAKP